MAERLKQLIVSPPDGETYEVSIMREWLDVGRAALEGSDAEQRESYHALPDAQPRISRRQCVFEFRDGRWHVRDTSRSGNTYVRRRDGVPARIEDYLPRGGVADPRDERSLALEADDVVVIYASEAKDGAPCWELRLCDPDITIGGPEGRICLEYDETGLYLREAASQYEIRLSPLEHYLIRHMFSMPPSRPDRPVFFSHEDLIRAVWPGGAQPQRLHDMVFDICNKINAHRPPWSPRVARAFIESDPGRGYRLIRCLTEERVRELEAEAESRVERGRDER